MNPGWKKVFEGEYKNNKRNGHGIIYSTGWNETTSKVEEGNFVDGKFL